MEDTTLRPIFIQCASLLDVAFATLFEATLGTISISSPILLDLRRTATDDRFGLDGVCAVLAKRRLAGGYAAFLVPSKRQGRTLAESDIPASYIVTSYPDQPRRLILLAQRPRTAETSSVIRQRSVSSDSLRRDYAKTIAYGSDLKNFLDSDVGGFSVGD